MRILPALSPILKPLYRWYSKQTRFFQYEGIKVQIDPGVFHPGLFFSTKAFLDELAQRKKDLVDKAILEMGCGTAILSIYCSQFSDHCVGVDISEDACRCAQLNVVTNRSSAFIYQSDLFESLGKTTFDLILANPPFYPQQAGSSADKAWFAGENLEYFNFFFRDLAAHLNPKGKCWMILSQDAPTKTIEEIASSFNISGTILKTVSTWGEKIFILEYSYRE